MVCRRFGTLYLFHLQRLDVKYEAYFILHIQPVKMEQTQCSETSENHNQTPGKYPKEYRQEQPLLLFTNLTDWGFFKSNHSVFCAVRTESLLAM